MHKAVCKQNKHMQRSKNEYEGYVNKHMHSSKNDLIYSCALLFASAGAALQGLITQVSI